MSRKSTKNQPLPVRQRLSLWSRHPFAIPVVTFLVLFFASLVIFINAGATTSGATDIRLVKLTIDDQQQVIPTRAPTVGDLLARLDIQLQEQDIVKPGPDTPIDTENMDIRVYKARPVMVVEGPERRVAYTAEPDPMRLAKQAGFNVHPEDRVISAPVETLSADDALREGIIAERLIIDRAEAVKLNLYGTTVTIRTHSSTVGDLLAEKQVKLNEGDRLQPSPETRLAPGVEIFVVSSGQQIVQQEEPVAPPVEYVDDYDLVLGATRVQEPGQPGRKLVTYEIVLENDVEVSRRMIQEVVVDQPVRQLVARGRKSPVVAGNKAEIMAAAGISPNEYFAADFIISHESGWRVNALNARGCAGLGQACPGSKLANACPNWQTDAVCQMRFFDGYARNRYGSWSGAYDAWQRQRWW